MSTSISDLQKGRLEKIVIENNTYQRYYEVKHEKDDSTLVTRNQKDITALKVVEDAQSKLRGKQSEADTDFDQKTDKARTELRDSQRKKESAFYSIHEKELNEHDKKADIARQAKDGAQSKEMKVLDKKENQLTEKLTKAGLSSGYRYGRNNHDGDWAVNRERFNDTYIAWMRDLRAKIITATSSEEAKKLVNEFLLK